MNWMKYAFDEELKRFRFFHPPLFRVFFPFASFLLRSIPRGFHKKKVTDHKLKLQGIRANLITPKGMEKETTPLIFYIHGGGFFFPAAPYHYQSEEKYALAMKARVADIDYSLSPKSVFPSQREECLKLYSDLYERKEELHLDFDHVLLMGDSAGASLCLDLYLRLKETSLPLPKGMMLIYPVVTPETIGESKTKFVDTPFWDAKADRKMWRCYLKGQEYVSPLRRSEEFQLDHLYVETCEFDCLHDEGLAFYEAIKGRVKHKELLETKGTYHGYDAFSKTKISLESMKRRLLFLSETASWFGKEL